MPTDNARYDDFDRMVLRHRAFIRHLCWWQASGHNEECADLVQECLLTLWHYRHTLRPGATQGQERQWVKYHCRSVFSHRNAKYRPWIVSLDEMQPLPQEEPPDNRERIEELARHLTDYEHRVLNLILDGYSLGDIAALLGIKTKSVSQIRYRIIEKMKKEI